MNLLENRFWQGTNVNSISHAAFMCREDRTCSDRVGYLDNASELCYSLNVDRSTYPAFFGWAYHLRMHSGGIDLDSVFDWRLPDEQANDPDSSGRC